MMGCRKDDLNRTPSLQRKRPLSAVIEEHEVDDESLKEEKDNDRNNNHVDDKPALEATNSSSVSRSSSSLSLTSSWRENGVPERPGCPEVPLEFPGQSVSSTLSTGSSPKLPRRSGGWLGRKSALIPSTSPLLGRRAFPGSPLLTASDLGDIEDDGRPSDLTRLKQTAERLCLSTRRPSVMQWRAQYVDSPDFPVDLNIVNGKLDFQGAADEAWTPERKQKINSALEWLRHELAEMRTQDQTLARQLLTIRSDIHQLKLARSCEQHQDMLDDVQSEMEELEEFSDVLDLPTHCLNDSPLKHLGVTRMNLSARRFSTC